MVFGLLHKIQTRKKKHSDMCTMYMHTNTANEHRKIYDYHIEYAKTKTLFRAIACCCPLVKNVHLKNHYSNGLYVVQRMHVFVYMLRKRFECFS